MRWSIFYVLLLFSIFSILFSRHRIRLGREAGAEASVVLSGERERGLLIFGLAVAGAFSLGVLFLAIFWNHLVCLLLLAPPVFLLAWSAPRPFIRQR